MSSPYRCKMNGGVRKAKLPGSLAHPSRSGKSNLNSRRVIWRIPSPADRRGPHVKHHGIAWDHGLRPSFLCPCCHGQEKKLVVSSMRIANAMTRPNSGNQGQRGDLRPFAKSSSGGFGWGECDLLTCNASSMRKAAHKDKCFRRSRCVLRHGSQIEPLSRNIFPVQVVQPSI